MENNNTSNQLGKAIVNEVEKIMRLYLDKVCNKYKSINREIVREACKETLGIEIGETRREFLEKEWDPENGFPFSKYKNGSHFKAKWICPFGHGYPAEIRIRIGGSGCPCCRNRKIADDKSNSLGVLRPEFIDSWDPNNELSIFDVSVGSNKIAKWICEKGHHYEMPITDRTSRGRGCSYCCSKKICEDGSNSLGKLRPDLINKWDPNNELSIFQVSVGSNKIVKWICEKGHIYPAMIYTITSRGDSCSFCSNKKICEDGSNSLGVLRPEFIDSWDPDNKLSIFRVSVGSNKIAKWICEKGHHYEMPIHRRTISQNGCSVCASKKIADDKSNSLGVLRPEFIDSWDLDNELSIFDVFVASEKIAKWICEQGHYYEMPICKRTSKTDPRGCPRCSESRGEKFVNKYLTKNNIEFNTQYKISYNECSNLRCDFYLEKYNTCIEFDGIQHFEEISIFGGEEGFLERIRNDNYKNLYCKENNITMIRIHYLDT